MNELQSILKAAEELKRLNEEAILATVVRVEGSSYRRPGARMLATVAGTRIGSVSGGCLERDVIRQSWERTGDGCAVVLTYDATAEDDGLWGLGLGCHGRIHILAERLNAADRHLDFIRRALAHFRDCVVATIFQVGAAADGGRVHPPYVVGHKCLLDSAGDVFDPHGLLDHLEIATAIRAGESERETRSIRIDHEAGPIDLLIEYIEPSPKLLIVGAGFDVVAVVGAAKALGWHVAVTDGRASHATVEHFPNADELLVCPPGEIFRRYPIDDRTYVVVMTHRYPDDLAALAGLLASPTRYIGLLGPEHRKQRLLMDLAAEGFVVSAEQLAKIFGPVGLDIGAEIPAEIAASIVAEIVAFRARRQGGHLKDYDGPIHDRPRSLIPTAEHLCPTESA